MAQEIVSISSPSFVQGKVREFIFMDNDGSQRVNVDGLAQYLMEQFSYATAQNAAPTTKQAQARAIAESLQASIGREAFASNPSYPVTPTSGSAESARASLIALHTEMNRQVHAATNPYREYEQTLATKVKAMFNTLVVPSFPQGIQLIETTRAYIETFVTDWGEESAPSPPSNLITLDQNDAVTVQCNSVPSGRHITHRRLYRSSTGTTQSAWRLLGEYPIEQGGGYINDTVLDEQLGEPCPTFGWLEPPAGLQGLVAMPNGMHLGFVGRTLHACEPYHPYAYPAKYDKPLAFDIVGLTAIGQSVFVGTTGRPYIVSGSDAASLSEELISSRMPCMSARSMVAIGGAVLYASADGLALYENGLVVNVSAEVFDRQQWRAYRPETMRAGEFDGRYIAFYTNIEGNYGALVFDIKSKTFSELDQKADAVFTNEDGIYVLDGTQIMDVLPPSGASRPGLWQSKEMRLSKPQSFGWIHVDSSFMDGMTPAPATLSIYADGNLHHEVTIESRAAVRCPPGRASLWRVEIESAARVEGVVLATTTEELKAAL